MALLQPCATTKNDFLVTPTVSANGRGQLESSIREIYFRENFVPRKFGAIRYSFHRNGVKQHRSKYTKNTKTESSYDVLPYLVPSFWTFVTRLLASPTSKQVY